MQFDVKWVDLEKTAESEAIQTHKHKHYMFFYMQFLTTNVQI